MKDNKENKKGQKKKGSKLLYVVAIVIAINGGIMIYNNINKDKSSETTSEYSIAATDSNGDIVINKSEVSDHALFLTYDVDGTDVGLFAVLAEDGTVRTALNTCQVCNGSPKAYFTQTGDKFQCNNCGNLFPTNDIGEESGGCNPVPLTTDVKEETDSEIIISKEYLEQVAPYFTNWKKS